MLLGFANYIDLIGFGRQWKKKRADNEDKLDDKLDQDKEYDCG